VLPTLYVLGDQSRYIMLGAHDGPLGVLANMGIARPSRWQLSFTLGTVIAVLNAVVGSGAVAFVTSVFGASLGMAAAIGATAAVLSRAVHLG
jgi:hypothetical protein